MRRWPQTPNASTIGPSSRPAAVRRYSKTPASERDASRATIPAASRSLSRCDSNAGDIRGTPRRSSLKRVEPAMSSRSKTTVQRVQSISAAIATGQNCL